MQTTAGTTTETHCSPAGAREEKDEEEEKKKMGELPLQVPALVSGCSLIQRAAEF